MTYFPLMLDLRGRPVLLLAGGPETSVKLKALLGRGRASPSSPRRTPSAWRRWNGKARSAGSSGRTGKGTWKATSWS